MNENEPTGAVCPEASPPKRDRWNPGWICWSEFLELPGCTKAIAFNVYYATDGEGHFSRATINLLRRHGVKGVYGPGACPS
jgi:hypothetical protein